MSHLTIGKYKILEYIASGSFGDVLKGIEPTTNQYVAIKAEKVDIQPSQVEKEKIIYQKANNAIGIPAFIDYFCFTGSRYLVLQYCGKNLEQLFEQCQFHFSLKTVLMIADQLLLRFEFLHNLNYIHRDIKPDNILVGLDSNSNTLYLSDFGLSAPYRNMNTFEHIPFCKHVSPLGNARFASLNAHFGNEVSRRDDLESIAYILIYFLKNGELPWIGMKANNRKAQFELVGMQKMTISIDALCSDIPSVFADFLRNVKSLQFDETPKYSEYRESFRNLFIEMGYEYDDVYDWTQIPPIQTSQSVNSKFPIQSESTSPNLHMCKSLNNDNINIDNIDHGLSLSNPNVATSSTYEGGLNVNQIPDARARSKMRYQHQPQHRQSVPVSHQLRSSISKSKKKPKVIIPNVKSISNRKQIFF